jgi:hypothetical protein
MTGLTMQEQANELIESAKSCSLARTPTALQVQRLSEAFAEYLACLLGGPVTVGLPGGFSIRRDEAESHTKAALRR